MRFHPIPGLLLAGIAGCFFPSSVIKGMLAAIVSDWVILIAERDMGRYLLITQE